MGILLVKHLYHGTSKKDSKSEAIILVRNKSKTVVFQNTEERKGMTYSVQSITVLPSMMSLNICYFTLKGLF